MTQVTCWYPTNYLIRTWSQVRILPGTPNLRAARYAEELTALLRNINRICDTHPTVKTEWV